MNLVFFGTNYDGSYFLQKLIKDFKIKIVVTDLIINDSWGRFLKRWLLHKKLTEDIARWRTGVVLIDQSYVTKNKFIKILKEFNIRLGIVATFGKIIPKDVINSIPLGIINLHPSLLPKYRGANPIFWAIRNGEKEFGITVHYLNEKIDAGDIIMQKKIPIEDHETIIDCKKNFFKEGTILLKKTIDMIANGKAKSFPQKGDESTYYPPAKEEYRTIYPKKHDYFQIKNIIRASIGGGGAIFWHQGKRILVKSISKTLPKRGKFIKIQVKNGNCFLLY
ncbi:MAG TPA: methionyl-tRNA formyltransferase [Candidatus Atribacteria bacterium]|nr:methionyl-tRNA formyltransferase [Candidatus Atribacteria bacterium]